MLARCSWGGRKATTGTSTSTTVRDPVSNKGERNRQRVISADNPLAEGFNLTQGSVKVKVPRVEYSNHYFVVCE